MFAAVSDRNLLFFHLLSVHASIVGREEWAITIFIYGHILPANF